MSMFTSRHGNNESRQVFSMHSLLLVSGSPLGSQSLAPHHALREWVKEHNIQSTATKNINAWLHWQHKGAFTGYQAMTFMRELFNVS